MSLFKTSSERFYTNSILCFVYSALLLDNLLLTAVVPLLPNLIHGSIVSSEEHSSNSKSRNDLFEFFKSSAEHFQRGYGAGENGKLGLLLSLKAVVQLAANPLVAIFTQKVGFSPALLVGNIVFMCSALMFAFGRSYELLAAARAFQGITSACFTVAGLGLTASVYKDELSRSRALGTALGGGAMGVLLGYPFGGMLYQFTGKTIPFLVIDQHTRKPPKANVNVGITINTQKPQTPTAMSSSYSAHQKTTGGGRRHWH